MAPPRGDRVRREVGRAAEPHVHGADVVRRGTLAHQLVVVDHRARPGDDLRHRVRQVRGITAAVALDNPHLRVLADDEQHARMGHHRLAAGGRRRDEEQLDRLLDHGVGRHAHHGAVMKERGVERRERLVLDGGGRGQVRLDRRPGLARVRREHIREAEHLDAVRQRSDIRRRCDATAVDEGQAGPDARQGVRRGIGLGRLALGRRGKRESGAGDRRDVGEPPRLEPRGRYPERGEALDGAAAQVDDRIRRGRGTAHRLEGVRIGFRRSERRHRHPATPRPARQRPRSSRSPSPRAPAPDPCRPTLRCGRPKGHAPRRARCS